MTGSVTGYSCWANIFAASASVLHEASEMGLRRGVAMEGAGIDHRPAGASEVQWLAPESLNAHPLNSAVYDEFDPTGAEFKELRASIEREGILEPLVISIPNTIISGHRRRMIALSLGLTAVPCIVRSFDSPLVEERVVIESNRYRKKSVSEVMREARALERIERELAAAHPGGQGGQTEEHIDVRRRVSSALGLGEHTYSKLKKLQAATESDDPKVAGMARAEIKKIDSGESSIHGSFERVSRVLYPKSAEDFEPKVYDYWAFGSNDPKYGGDWPGRTPGQCVENWLWYWLPPPPALIVDPFAGSGTTMDVCKAWGYRCASYDISPSREGISHYDISGGFPPEVQDCDGVWLDPPYWNMVDNYAEGSASFLGLPEFVQFMAKLAKDCYDILAPAGVVGLIMLRQWFKLPEGIPFIDWPFVATRKFQDAGFAEIARVSIMWPTSQWVAPQVEKAKQDRQILPTCGDMVVLLKPGLRQFGGDEA